MLEVKTCNNSSVDLFVWPKFLSGIVPTTRKAQRYLPIRQMADCERA